MVWSPSPMFWAFIVASLSPFIVAMALAVRVMLLPRREPVFCSDCAQRRP